MRALFCATAVALMLAACSWVPRLGVYKLDINQGNYITSEQVEHRQFTVYFVDDKVARWEGDEMPPSPVEVARSGGGDAALDKSLSSAPKTGEENWLQQLFRKMGWWQ